MGEGGDHRSPEGPTAGLFFVPSLRPGSETPAGPNSRAEVVPPTQVSLRAEGGRPEAVTAALTPGALWVQYTWRLRRLPLRDLSPVEERLGGRELALAFGPAPSAERLALTFATAAEGQRWCRELQALQQQLPPDAPPDDRPAPEGVALVVRAPDVPHTVLGRVEFTGHTLREADRGLQLRAGLWGADAVLEVQRHKVNDSAGGARHASGVAVRVEDADARRRLRRRWYAEEAGALASRMLVLLVLQAALLFLLGVFCAGVSSLVAPTGETTQQALASGGLGIGLLYGWPLALLALLRVFRWPGFLRATGLAVLAATTGRGLTVWLAHLLAAAAGRGLAGRDLWVLADPIDWAFVISGVVLCVRAWRLARDSADILPREAQAVPTARKAWAHGLLAASAVYALALGGFIGHYRFQASAHLLQPGVDPRREHEALLALNQGLAHANKGDLGAAEQSWQRSLRLWEELTAKPPVPSAYRVNLAMTLNNLGWLRHRQGRVDAAETYYARAVALADALAGDPRADEESKKALDGAREALAELRGEKSFKLLGDKDRAAGRKYEEAQVKADKGDAAAEGLCQEAIATWEEILPQATNPDYRKDAVARLAVAYLLLGELQQKQGKRAEAEAAVRKSIDYGEQAVALDPDRPLPKHNLEVARQTLDGLREQALQEEIAKLSRAERFADAVELFLRGIDEQEEQARAGQDRPAALRRLASRLDRLAWFLAHCPDGRVRDTGAAVRRARRATELQPDVGDYWYTLAMTQYRNGDWRDSLASLEKVKGREGGFDASAWLLVAMNRQQLKQREEARAALRQAAEWLEEQQRKAEGNALLRLQLEMMRPAVESLRREAEKLIEGKNSEGDRVG
jgi:tetratricopeptide (TPR) repeat protein